MLFLIFFSQETIEDNNDIIVNNCILWKVYVVVDCIFMTQIDPDSPFSVAFKLGSSRWRWVSNVIGVGASFGILTSLLVAMLGQARYMCVIGRSCVIPSWFARVHSKTSTPVNASAFLGTLSHLINLASFLPSSGAR